MADQQMPPEVAAAMQGPGGQPPPGTAPPPPPPPMAAVDEQAVCDALMRAIKTCAEKGPASSTNDPRETAEFAKAALAYAQAYVAIHPGLIAPQGVPPEVMAAAVPVQGEGSAETAAEGGQETAADRAAEGG